MKPETLALHAGYTSDPTTSGGGADLPNHLLHLRRHPPRRRFVQLRCGRQHLHPHYEPHHRCARSACGRARRWHCRFVRTASGMAAITYAVQTLVEAGDNIIATKTLYGGTYNFFAHNLPRQGIEVRFIDPERPEQIAEVADERTRLVYCESIGNPAINVVDMRAFAQTAHAQGLPLMVDNTVPSPALFRPIEHGADIVVQSLTKYIGGHRPASAARLSTPAGLNGRSVRVSIKFSTSPTFPITA